MGAEVAAEDYSTGADFSTDGDFRRRRKGRRAPASSRFYQGLSEVLNTIDAASPQKRKFAPLAQKVLIISTPRRPSVDEAGVEQRDHSLLSVTQPLQPPQFPQTFSPHTVLSQFHRRAFSCALHCRRMTGSKLRRLHNADPRFCSIASVAHAAPDNSVGPVPISGRTSPNLV